MITIEVCMICFAGWFVAQERSSSAEVTVCCLDEKATSVLYAVIISRGFNWTVSLRGCNLDKHSCSLFNTSPETVSAVCLLSVALRSFCVCEGNSDERFLKLSKLCKGRFTDASGYVMLCERSKLSSPYNVFS